MNPLGHVSKMTTTSICCKCGLSYVITHDEQGVIPNINLNFLVKTQFKPKIVLATWSDWIEHIFSHCHECRYEQPPRACRQDFERVSERNRSASQ